MELKIKKHKDTTKGTTKRIMVTREHRVEYKSYYNVNDFMFALHEWLVDNDWATPFDQDFKEVFYHHKFMQGGLSEVRWRWLLQRNGLGDSAGFIKYEVYIKVLIIAMSTAEVMKRGMKFKTNYGDIDLYFTSYLVIDEKGKWNNFFNRWLYNYFYVDRVLKRKIEMHKTFLRREVNRMINSVKAFFKIPTKHAEKEDEGAFYSNIDFE
jgi:hypothetical protein